MKSEIISQYKASMKMLTDTIVKCPESLWEDDSYENSYWRIVYHVLFYTDLYLSESPDKFTPWPKHCVNYNCLGSISFDDKPIVIEHSYSKTELINYAELIFNGLEDRVSDIGGAEKSGFEWLSINRTELHLYNIRHIQHHTGQLVERLHQAGIKGINWRGWG